jgi:hypothetical protein
MGLSVHLVALFWYLVIQSWRPIFDEMLFENLFSSAHQLASICYHMWDGNYMLQFRDYSTTIHLKQSNMQAGHKHVVSDGDRRAI